MPAGKQRAGVHLVITTRRPLAMGGAITVCGERQ
jgi:hypothetical protein